MKCIQNYYQLYTAFIYLDVQGFYCTISEIRLLIYICVLLVLLEMISVSQHMNLLISGVLLDSLLIPGFLYYYTGMTGL